jgi:hypothetical protein
MEHGLPPLEKNPSIFTKAKWWMDSVRGLYTNIRTYKEIRRRYANAYDIEDEEEARRFRVQQRMELTRWETTIGRSVLYVIGEFPIGSGRFL